MQELKWHEIKSRPMDKEEVKEWSEKHGIDAEYFDPVLFSNLPDEGEVLVCTKWGHVYIDTYCDDGDGGYFEENGEIDGIVAWMPLPKPYTLERGEECK